MPLPPATLIYLASRPWELGDIPTWLGALANVATVILALAAAIVGYRVYKVESGRDARTELDRRERALDERRRQAALVSVWYAPSADQSHMLTTSDGHGFGPLVHTWGAWIRNASGFRAGRAEAPFDRPADQGRGVRAHLRPAGSGAWVGGALTRIAEASGISPAELEQIASAAREGAADAAAAALATFTPDALAEAVVRAMPAEQARQVADELAARLAS